MARRTISSDLETLGFLELKELDSRGFTTAPGATPMMSDALMSVTVSAQLGSSAERQVDGSAYRQVDFTAGSGASFRDTTAFGLSDSGSVGRESSLVAVPVLLPTAPAAPPAPVNHAPTALDNPFSVSKNSGLQNHWISAADADGDTLTYSVISTPAVGTFAFNAAAGTYDYTPPNGYTGSVVAQFLVSDGRGGSTTSTHTITVANDAPVAVDRTFVTAEDTPIIVTAAQLLVGATDQNGDALDPNLVQVLGVASGSATILDNGNGTWTITPSADWNGTVTLNVRISDGDLTDDSLATVAVNAVNDAPVLAAAVLGTTENIAPGTVIGSVVATDVDGDTVTYAMVNDAGGKISVDANTGDLIVSGAIDFEATPTLTIRVSASDGNGGVVERDYTITVGDVAEVGPNNAPVALDDAYTLSMDTPDNGWVAASDLDGDSLTYTVQTAPQHGTLLLNADGTYTYTPDNGYVGLDSFDVLVEDGNDGSDVCTKEITMVGPVNQASITDMPGSSFNKLDNGFVQTFALSTITHPDPNAVLSITVTLDDKDKGTLVGPGGTYNAATGVWSSSGTAATLQFELGFLTFAPADDRVALGSVETTTLSLMITDGNSGSFTGTATVNSTPSNGSIGDDTWTMPFGYADTTAAIYGNIGNDSLTLQAGTNAFFAIDGVETINGSASNDSLTLVTTDSATISLIDLGAGTDQLVLGEDIDGNHFVRVANVESVASTGTNDTVTVYIDSTHAGGAISVDLSSTSGATSVRVSNNLPTVDISLTGVNQIRDNGDGAGSITINLLNNVDNLALSNFGGAADTVNLAAGTNNLLFAIASLESVNGTASSDDLTVQNGNWTTTTYSMGDSDDRFELQGGFAKVYGGTGADTFVGGNLTTLNLMDFNTGEGDKIDVSAWGANDWRLTAIDGTRSAIEVTNDGWGSTQQVGTIYDAAIAADVTAAIAAMNAANAVVL